MTLKETLKVAPDLRSAFKVRVGIHNVISLFERGVEVRDRLA